MEQKLFDLFITRRKDKSITEIPEGQEGACLKTDRVVITDNFAEKISQVNMLEDTKEKDKAFRELFNKIIDVNGNEFSFDIDDIYMFTFQRHKEDEKND